MAEVEVEADVTAALARLGLARPGERLRFERLTGGVSSDIWRLELGRGPVCVRLKGPFPPRFHDAPGP